MRGEMMPFSRLMKVGIYGIEGTENRPIWVREV
jgi:hypothetical protein